jgi:hypothetical protein
MTNNSGEIKAQANTAGIFLKENGTPGIMQQIDYVV